MAAAATLRGGTLTSDPEVAAGIRMFEAWLNSQMEYRGLPGVAVGVVCDQELVWSRGFGYADVEKKVPVTPKTLFRMASNTKMFTATAVMQLRDAGKLRLDDPVARHLPWFQTQPAGEDDGPVRIEHLLTHGSGLPREAAFPYWSTFAFPTAGEIRKTVASQRAAYAPDTRWKYSNLAFALAGMVVEEVSGEPYGAYLRRHILDPLGMTASSLDTPAGGLATGYGRRMPDGSRKRMPFLDCKGIGPAGGLTSNVEDMARFIALQLGKGGAGGRGVLDGATLREMHRVRILENNWTRGYGIGFMVKREREKVYVGHGGSLAGYKTHTMFRPGDKVGVVVLTNGDDSRPEQIADRAFQMIGEPLAKAYAPKKAPAWDPAWRRFAGLYRSVWGDIEVVELAGELGLIDPTSEDPVPQMNKLVPAGDGTFRLEGPSGGAAVGEPVAFVEEAGRVRAVRVGGSVSERVR